MTSRLFVLLLIGLCTACAPLSRQSTGPAGEFDVIELSIDQAHDALRTGRISCEQLTQRYLRRIDAYDLPSDATRNPPAMSSQPPTGELNAVIAINPNALTRARQRKRSDPPPTVITGWEVVIHRSTRKPAAAAPAGPDDARTAPP